ncbi:MAG: hypothetical protein J6B77_04810 [Clostridia bacterium]|nr:hypothetical protein [Clostridia bacterium]
MKRKAAILILLVFAVLLCAVSCDAHEQHPEASDGTTVGDSDAQETLGPIEAAKASFLSLMNDTFGNDPNELLSAFFGDYTVKNARFASDDESYPERFYRKGSVLMGEYEDGTVQYTVLQNRDLATIVPVDGGYAVAGYQMNSSKTDLSVFSTFGVAVENPQSAEVPEGSFDDLITEDTIVVNEDGTVCTVTEEVLDAILAVVYGSFETLDQNAAAFQGTLHCDLEYSVPDRTLRLAVSGEIEEIGTLLFEMEASDGANGASVHILTDMDTMIEGLSSDIHAEKSYTDFRYDPTGRLIGFTQAETMKMSAVGAQNGELVHIKSSESTVITVDATDVHAPSITVVSDIDSETYTTSIDVMTLDLTSEISAVLGENGKITVETRSGDVVLLSVEADLRMQSPEMDFSEVERVAKQFFKEMDPEGSL